MPARDAEAFLPLKPRVFVILAILRDRPLHGYGVLKKMRERAGGSMRMDAGLLYRTFARLTAQGIICEAPEHADPADTRRRYYRLTAFGGELLAAEVRRQTDFLGTLAVLDSTPS